MKSIRHLLLIAACLVTASSMQAQKIISIKLADAAGNNLMSSTDLAGADYRVGNWNNVQINANSVTAQGSALVFSDNATLNVGGTFNVKFDLRTSHVAGSATTNDAKLFSGIAQLSNQTTNTVTEGFITVSNIPFASYSIYVYVTGQNSSGQPTRGGSVSLGSETFYIRGETTPTNTGGNYLLATSTTYEAASPSSVAGGNYVLFDGLSGTSQVVTLETLFMGDAVNHRLGIAGIQIVDTSIPEPAQSGLIFGLLTLAAFGLRRRR